MKQYKYLAFITTLFSVVLILSNIASSKILSLGWFSFDGGTILFPLAYIFGDVLTEVYGYANSRRVIWTGFIMNLLMVFTFFVVGILPPAMDWGNQGAYDAILGVVPRIVLGSLCAYLIGEFLNSYILAKLKVKTAGKYFWLRAIGSTLVGEFFDTTIFLLIAFAGVLPWDLIWIIWISNYIFKVGIEIIFLPLTYRVVNFLKKKENEDFFDKDTNFNPLHLNT
ncbi:MAG: queuosine precursor transporter [Candidatus Magasanikiibacteriota bacterium]